MASRRVMGLMNLILLLLLNPAAATMGFGFIGPTPTSVGLNGIQRMAPRPTRPPSMNEIDGELRKRRLPDSIYSAIPDSWCGFVGGDFDSPITCPSSSSQTCVFISSYIYTSIACSPYDIAPTIYESCLDSTKWASMSTVRSSDTTVCSRLALPYCHTATFSDGEYELYCDSTTQISTISLEYLDAWFSTGSIPPILTQNSRGSTKQPTVTPIMPTEIPSITPTPPPKLTPTTAVASSSDGGLAAPAIAGIGVAVGAVVIGAIAALGVCLFMRRRKRKERVNQPEEIPTGPSNPPMQQGNPGQGWQTVAPVSSYPNSQTAFLKSPEQPSPPYSSEPGSIYNPHSSSISSPVTPYDSNGRTGSTGQYPLSQNPSATASFDNKIPPSFMSPVHKPGELPIFGNSPDHATQPPSPISTMGRHGGETRLGSPIDNQVHEMSTGLSLHNNPRGNGTSQSPPYHDVSSSVPSPTRGNSGTQSPPPLHSIHEAPQTYYGENQAHGMVSSPISRQGDDMSPPTPAAPAVVAPTPRINSGTYEGQQQAQNEIHEAPPTSYTAYSPGASPATRGPLEVYHNNNAQ